MVNSNGTFGYTPELNWSGDDSFSYKLTDSRVDSNIATVTVTVTAVNNAPVAADAQMATLEEQVLVIELRNHVADVDDVQGSTSVAGAGSVGATSGVTTFTSQIITGPAQGVLLANTDGSYTYTPNADFNGLDSFTYKTNDGELDSNSATVIIEERPPGARSGCRAGVDERRGV